MSYWDTYQNYKYLLIVNMDERKINYRKEYYLKNKNKLIEYGKKYYLTRINPTVEIEIIHGNFTLFFD